MNVKNITKNKTVIELKIYSNKNVSFNKLKYSLVSVKKLKKIVMMGIATIEATIKDPKNHILYFIIIISF